MFCYIHSQKCQGYELLGVRGCCEINKDNTFDVLRKVKQASKS